MRWFHRDAGLLFAAVTIIHLAVALGLVVSGRVRPSIVPTRKDFRDAVIMMRYYSAAVRRAGALRPL